MFPSFQVQMYNIWKIFQCQQKTSLKILNIRLLCYRVLGIDYKSWFNVESNNRQRWDYPPAPKSLLECIVGDLLVASALGGTSSYVFGQYFGCLDLRACLCSGVPFDWPTNSRLATTKVFFNDFKFVVWQQTIFSFETPDNFFIGWRLG